ncbi:hypothetical protein H0H92_006834 [Tricholoma furcatifolium]|nr:hypothetical protein H0H92_006834 [Tricholoma furcatifolium]
MPLSIEQQVKNHNTACEKYRKKNLEKLRATARERMCRLRAQRKDDEEITTSRNNELSLSHNDLAAAVGAALMALHQHGPNIDGTEQRRSMLDDLPPSSEPDYSDSASDISDVGILPEVTSDDDEESDWYAKAKDVSTSEENFTDEMSDWHSKPSTSDDELLITPGPL